MSGNIAGLHQSRAEYFILNGVLDEAERQLNYALKLTRGDYLTSATIRERLIDIQELREQMESGMEYLRKRFKANKFIAYFQAYTNTYSDFTQKKCTGTPSPTMT